ncbi:MAG: hypothetical protein P4L36_13600 [Holophaga sp.]|nr:hypothetical protein [Holophaga sp.]
MKRMFPVAMALVFSAGMNAQNAPLEVQAKFVKILLASSGQFGFACNDPALKAKLESMGVSVGPGFKYAWGSSEPEVRALKAQDRFIICPNLDWLKVGGCIAVVMEGGKPQLYLHVANTKASGVTVADAIVKIAKKI